MHIGHRGHDHHAGVPHFDPKPPIPQLLGHEGRLLRVAAPPVLDLDGIARVQLVSQLDELLARPRLLIVIGRQPGERRAVKFCDDVPYFEARLVRRAAWGHGIDLGAELVRLRSRVGPHDYTDPTAILTHRVGEAARDPRRPPDTRGRSRRVLGGEYARPRHAGRHGEHNQLPLHLRYPSGLYSPT